MRGSSPEVHDPNVRGERVAAEGLEHVAGEIRGPPAVGDHYRTAFEDAPRRPSLEARATHLRLEQQQVRAVRQYAEGYPAARVQPRRGVSRGLDLVAPGKRRLGPARQRRGAPGPTEQPVPRAQPPRPYGHAVDGLAETRVAGIASRPGSRGDHQAVLGIAECDLAHHAGDAAPERREVAGEEEGGGGGGGPTRRRAKAPRQAPPDRPAGPALAE